MISTLLSHGFKQVRRSPIWAKNVVTNIVLGLFALMLLIYALLLGLLLHDIAGKVAEDFYPGYTNIQVISGFVLYYFSFEFILRFFLQNTPVLFINLTCTWPSKSRRSFTSCSAKAC